MTTTVETAESGVVPASAPEEGSLRDLFDRSVRYCRRNPSLVVGLVLFFLLLLSSG